MRGPSQTIAPCPAERPASVHRPFRRVGRSHVTLGLPVFGFLSSVARAADLPNCGHSASQFTCRLDVALHILTWLAIALGALLFVVVCAALGFYRSKRSPRQGEDEF